MKKEQFKGKLTLRKETVTELTKNKMMDVKGGALIQDGEVDRAGSNFACVSTGVGHACATNNHSCMNSCNSWVGCAA